MQPTTCVAADSPPPTPGSGVSAEPGSSSESSGHRGAQGGEERREGFGVKMWLDGSRYEGEFVNGLKHGRGRYTWAQGEIYEGSFYKDYRHGDGVYHWPTGQKFIGKFYLNRKEGYGQYVFPDGSTFQGLFYAGQSLGPGVVSYPDGRQDVGLWHSKRLLRLCTALEDGFSLKIFPEYAAYAACMDPAETTHLTQPPILTASQHTEVHTDRELQIDEKFILPPDMELYSTDADHLPLPPGRRKELDQHFYGELWEPEVNPYKGYKRFPLNDLPLQARMQAHIHINRRLAENVGWDVDAVLSLNRDGFGPKGSLELGSEQMIQHASRGEREAVFRILRAGLIHPDVADSRGHNALIAATVNCHNDVINLLLNMGVDIDRLNCEGMSALAVCHVIYYPFQSLHTALAEPPAESQVSRSPSACESSSQISQVGSTAETCHDRPQTSDQTAGEMTKHMSHHSQVSKDSELISEHGPGLNEAETSADTGHQLEEERDKDGKETQREGEVQVREKSSHREDEGESKGEEGKTVGEHDQPRKDESEGGSKETDAESGMEDVELREDGEEDVEERMRHVHKEDEEEKGSVERSIQVLDGHIVLGSVQWKESRAKAAAVVQDKDKDLTQDQTFDSACSVSSYNIQVTEEVMQRAAEALSRTGFPQRPDTQETVRRMAAMKIEHRRRLKTIELLLERGADPNVSKVPMPVLFLAVMAADTEAVRRLLLCGARTDIPLPPERKGLYPLHVAAALPGSAGPTITELLLHTIPDPDAQACDQDEIYEPDKVFRKAQKTPSTNQGPHLKEGGRTALHVACQRDSDYLNASKVVALLLSHRASTDLLWSGHSPLSLAIASGNDLAVEELLKGGADPNIPLGHGVGSALCVLANFNYHLGGNRLKLLNMLAKAGADIMMPVMVGDVMGSAVDYAHFSFNQDSRIAKTPFHALNMRERETFKARHHLLNMMRDLLRRRVGQLEADRDREQQLSVDGTSSAESFVDQGENRLSLSCKGRPHVKEKHRKPLFKFCYHCGRSVSVKLTSCSRCHKVFYCSTSCKLKAWDEIHKEECIRASASANDIEKRVAFKSQRGPRPTTVTLKSKTVPRPASVRLTPQSLPRPMRLAEKVSESQVNLEENYSYN